MRSKRKPNAQREGAAAVEFAMVLPFILTIFFGAIEVTNLNHVRNMSVDAAFRVTRALIVPGGDSQTAVKESTEFLSKIGIRNVSFEVEQTTTHVTVSISVPVDDNAWAIGRIANGMEIQETCTLKKSFKSDT